ncbi:MAG: hypothetical protein JNM56_17050 [Planctomycetia bacterium]|nr:hypothetical protein [Planctomycetia bacterium]
MGRHLRFVVLLAVLLLFPALTDAQVGKQAKVDPEKVRAKLLLAQYIEGKLIRIDPKDKTFTFAHTIETKSPNAEGQKKLTAAYQAFNQALAKRSTPLADLKKLQKAGMEAEKGAFNIEETQVSFELKGNPTFVVRTLVLPKGADGKVQKLTPAEEKKLKGDPKQPGYNMGYAADVEDLNQKQWVRAYIDKRTKATPGEKPSDTVHPATMLVIIPDPPVATSFKIPGE